MHKKSFIFCGLVCITGIFGAFIRWVQNTSAFDPETGLATPQAFWSYAMAVFMVLCAAVLVFLVRRLNSFSSADAYPDAFSGGKAICTGASFAVLILMGSGGLLTTVDAVQRSAAVSGGMSAILFDLVGGLLAIGCAVSLFFILRGINRPEASGRSPFVVVVLFMCFRLIAEYKTCASDPVLWHFAVRILAISAVLLAVYYLAGFRLGRSNVKKTVYFSFLGIILSISTLADRVSVGYHLITVGFILALLMFSLLLVGNLTPRNLPEEKAP